MSILNNSTTLAPYSILPTLLALGVKLWLGAIGDNLKLLQPYVSMVRGPVPVSKSVLAEYVNTPIAMISAKALRNSHWILAFVGFGALAAETCEIYDYFRKCRVLMWVHQVIVGMSALWDREIGTLSHPVNVTRRLELRTIPHIFHKPYYQHGVYKDTTHTVALASIYQSSLQSWLYGAAVELSQSGSTPAWSKDTWSFARLDTEDLQGAASSFGSDATHIPGYARNVTFRTSGLRARLECHTLDYPFNTSAWLTTLDFTDRTINPDTNQSTWNATNSPPGLDYGYTLTGMAGSDPRFGYFACCANETEKTPGDAAIGYWTSLLWDLGTSGKPHWGDMQMSMTAKFIVGRPLDKLYQPNRGPFGFMPPLFIWTERPNFLLINCTPFIEHATASVVAELETGVVQSYDILEPPLNATEAWLDNYLLHNTSVDYNEEWTPFWRTVRNTSTYHNMTTRYLYLDFRSCYS